MVVPEPTADRPRPSAIPRVASLASPPIKVGMQVSVSGARGSLTGTVRFVGVTQFATGEWIGVDLGKPEGRNDGSVNDVRYFDCEPKCGLFVKRAQVRVIKDDEPTACLLYTSPSPRD